MSSDTSYKKWLPRVVSDGSQSHEGSQYTQVDSLMGNERAKRTTPLVYIPLRRSNDGLHLPKLKFATEKSLQSVGQFSQKYDHTKQIISKAHEYKPTCETGIEQNQSLIQTQQVESVPSGTSECVGYRRTSKRNIINVFSGGSLYLYKYNLFHLNIFLFMKAYNCFYVLNYYIHTSLIHLNQTYQ